ncbi:excinuclease ABC subunit UvrC [Streptomyces roseolilacinus]|uniref:hypothetical protein n=1 Tax=Streptomyces roseolilacinus TaxID=66904 RepID=UPI0037F78286
MTADPAARRRDIEPPPAHTAPEQPWALWLGGDLERLYGLFAERQLAFVHAAAHHGLRPVEPRVDGTVRWVRDELVRLGVPHRTVLAFEADMAHIPAGPKPDAAAGEEHTRVARRMDALMYDVAGRLDGTDRALYDVGVALTRLVLCLRMVDGSGFPGEVGGRIRRLYRTELRRTTLLLGAFLGRLEAVVRETGTPDTDLLRELRLLGAVLERGLDPPGARREAYRRIRRVHERAGLFLYVPLPEDGPGPESGPETPDDPGASTGPGASAGSDTPVGPDSAVGPGTSAGPGTSDGPEDSDGLDSSDGPDGPDGPDDPDGPNGPEGERDLAGWPLDATLADLRGGRDRVFAALRGTGDARAAVTAIEELRTRYRLALGPHHRETLALHGTLAQALLAAGRRAEAVDLAFDTAATAAYHYGPRHPDTALVVSLLLPVPLHCGDPDALARFAADHVDWLFTGEGEGPAELFAVPRAHVLRALREAAGEEP